MIRNGAAAAKYANYEVELNDIVSANIRAESAVRRITQTELADSIGLTRAAVSHKWNGRRPWTLEDIQKVSLVLNLEPAELLRDRYSNSAQEQFLRAISQSTPPGTRTQNPLIKSQVL